MAGKQSVPKKSGKRGNSDYEKVEKVKFSEKVITENVKKIFDNTLVGEITYDIPSVWTVNSDLQRFKQCFFHLNITLSPKKENQIMSKPLYLDTLQKIKLFIETPTIENSDEVFQVFGIDSNKTRNCCLLFKALFPEQFLLKGWKNTSELTRKGSHFSPLFDLAICFTEYKRCGNQVVGTLFHEKEIFNNVNLAIKSDEFLVRNYVNRVDVIKLIREDKPKNITHHFEHEDFFKLIVRMRLSLAYAIRGLITSPTDIIEGHSKLYNIGINTNADKSHVYMMNVLVTKSNRTNVDFDLGYNLVFVGTFTNNEDGSPFLTISSGSRNDVLDLIESETTQMNEYELIIDDDRSERAHIQPPIVPIDGACFYTRSELVAFLLCAFFDDEFANMNQYLLNHKSSSLCNSTKKVRYEENFKCSKVNTEFGELTFVADKNFRYHDDTKIVMKGQFFLNTNCETPLMSVYLKTNSSSEVLNFVKISNTLLTPFFDFNLGLFSIAGDVDLRMYSKIEINDRENQALECLIDILVQIEILLKLNRLHNDVKPQNIIRIDNHWFLIDHEMHICFNSIDSLRCCDLFGNVITNKSGTKGYFSPEKQESGQITVNGDVYSLGLSILGFISTKPLDHKKINVDEHFSSEKLRTVLKQMLDSNYSTRSHIGQCLAEISKFSGAVEQARKFYSDTNYFKNILSEQIKLLQLNVK